MLSCLSFQNNTSIIVKEFFKIKKNYRKEKQEFLSIRYCVEGLAVVLGGRTQKYIYTQLHV